MAILFRHCLCDSALADEAVNHYSVTARSDNDEAVHKRNDKKMSSLFDEVFIIKIKGSHQKKQKSFASGVKM